MLCKYSNILYYMIALFLMFKIAWMDWWSDPMEILLIFFIVDPKVETVGRIHKYYRYNQID